MIANLHIQNIGIIDDISINFQNGFNVLTGETGAGKTLIIDSLSIIAGGRFSKEMIRKGQDHSFVEICLYLPEHENAIDGNVILSREIYANGRNLCKINGRMVTVNELREFMKKIIDIHGQQDNQMILDSSTHIEYLDNFSGESIKKLQEEYYKFYQEYLEIEKKLKENYGDEKEKQRKLDLLKYQVNEIEAASLKEDEEEELDSLRTKMLNSEKIVEGLKEVDTQIGENAIESISRAVKALEKIEGIDSQYEEKLNNLKSIYYDLQELERDISSYKDEIDFDEETRRKTELRLDLIFSLKRKYGNTIPEIINYCQVIKKEIETIENLEEYTKQLKEEERKLKEQMKSLADQMNQIRVKQAEILSNRINQELQELEMKNANFSIRIEERQDSKFGPLGLDEVEFLIRTNVGEDDKPLIKIASGGEMSRIMLAIKNVLADVDEVPILIFDEIDTGISGIAASSVAIKMKQIARNHQVLCVTHLASIAAKGEYNYFISKVVEKEQTKTSIKRLQEDEVIKEIARIASGTISQIAIEHAKELRKA